MAMLIRMTPLRKEHLGSELDTFLEGERLLDHAEAVATKPVPAWEITRAMKAQGRKLSIELR